MAFKPVLNPKEIPERFGQSWNRYDATGIADLFFDKADFVNVTGKWWDNKEDIRKAHDFGFRVIFKNSKLEVLKVKVKNISSEIAVVHARIRVTGQTKKEVEKDDVRETMFVFIARKTKGKWKSEYTKNNDIIFSKQT